MNYRFKEINKEIDRISNNSPYTLVETQKILLILLKKIKETGELIELIGFKSIRKEVEKDD